jgi:hypothetical protein
MYNGVLLIATLGRLGWGHSVVPNMSVQYLNGENRPRESVLGCFLRENLRNRCQPKPGASEDLHSWLFSIALELL